MSDEFTTGSRQPEGREIRRFDVGEWITTVAFTADGRRALCSGWQTCMLLDLESGKELQRMQPIEANVMVWSVALSPDNRTILAGCSDKTIRLIDAASGRELRRLVGHVNDVRAVAYSPDGSQALTGSEWFSPKNTKDDVLRLWDVGGGRELRKFDGHDGDIEGVAFLPGGRQAVSASSDKTLRLWDLASGRQLRVFTDNVEGWLSVAVSPDGSRILSGGWNGTVRLWDTAAGRELRRFEGHISEVHGVAFSPDGLRAVSGSGGYGRGQAPQNTTVRIWDIQRGQQLSCLEGHTNRVWSVAFSPDGKYVLSGSRDRTVRLWLA